jgi:hypothetical protein
MRSPARILVVDDHKAVRRSVAALLVGDPVGKFVVRPKTARKQLRRRTTYVPVELPSKSPGTPVSGRGNVDLEAFTSLSDLVACMECIRRSFARPDSATHDKEAIRWHVLFSKAPRTGVATSLARSKDEWLYSGRGGSDLQQRA